MHPACLVSKLSAGARVQASGNFDLNKRTGRPGRSSSSSCGFPARIQSACQMTGAVIAIMADHLLSGTHKSWQCAHTWGGGASRWWVCTLPHAVWGHLWTHTYITKQGGDAWLFMQLILCINYLMTWCILKYICLQICLKTSNVLVSWIEFKEMSYICQSWAPLEF